MLVDLKQFKVMECRHGIHVWPKADKVIGAALQSYGEFAEGENRLMARYLKQGDVVLDVGANIGTTSLSLARAVGPEGAVWAFEPQPIVARCLATTMVLNGIDNVRLFTAALGATQATVRMDFAAIGEAANHGVVAISDQGDPVIQMRLDDLDLRRCHLIKIDVEGYEWQVIQGAMDTITRLKPVIYFEAKASASTQEVMRALLAQGYALYWHFSFFYRQDNFRQKAENIFPNKGDMNILALPKDAPAPPDLPKIAALDEDWRTAYLAFFSARKIPMP